MDVYFMVEADTHLKLLPTSILNVHNVFEHTDMLSIGIQKQTYTVNMLTAMVTYLRPLFF